MEQSLYRIEVFSTEKDMRGTSVQKKCAALGFPVTGSCVADNYLLNIDITPDEAKRAAGTLAQAVTQNFTLNAPFIPNDFSFAFEVGFLPGVTDNVSHTVLEMMSDLFKKEFNHETSVFSSVTFFLSGKITREQVNVLTLEYYNPLIQRVKVLSHDEYIQAGGMGRDLPLVSIHERAVADIVDLNVSEDQLICIGREGIADRDGFRRGPLALDKDSLNAIKKYFLETEKRSPRDIELESIAQTWSEHCKHTIFAADIDGIKEGFFKRYIRESTIKIRAAKGADDFCVSVFEDNAGGIDFDETWVVADKVETHNSPSALDPFGGSITGIVGVNRDAMGFGHGAKPVANRYGFCFASPFDTKPLYRAKNKDAKLLPPRRIMDGVINGVNVGGNCSGIPTPQGFVYFDPRYKGKPLVFVGTVGLIPKMHNGRSLIAKKAMPGDLVVMAGGRVGRDGIHGATFSSEALSSGSPATAVQIGDPITQKKMSDALVKEARDMNLYHSITDNGAGGLSCSVAEMAKESGGFEVDLELIPLKYPGLAPWQIWVSESQERMTLAIPPQNWDAFSDLMKRRGVEATVIGTFTASGRGVARYHGDEIFNLDMDFLHNGLPQKHFTTTYTRPDNPVLVYAEPDYQRAFTDMLSRHNTSSFKFISHQYDFEVQAGSVIKPLQGKGLVNGDASVIRPVLTSKKGVVLSHALFPSYSDVDTYHMAACSIDTAIRNSIAVGGTLSKIALLDNFCWCDSTNSERLGQLKAALEACYEYSIAYGAPFVSGKDSMFNDFKGFDEAFNPVSISVPPTLLISSFGVIEDVSVCQTMDFKFAGDRVYLVGTETADELGGSEYLSYTGEKTTGAPFIGNSVPRVDADKNIRTYRAFEKASATGCVASAISLHRGGLAYAVARSCMAGMTGAHIDLSKVKVSSPLRSDTVLFSETQGRMLVSVNPAREKDFCACMANVPYACIGEVSDDNMIVINGADKKPLINISAADAAASHSQLFSDF